MKIKKLENGERLPMELLLLADPSEELVKGYTCKGMSYVAQQDGETVGVYVLMPTGAGTVELMNIAVPEHLHGRGIGKALVLDAIRTAKSLGYTRIEVGTGNSSIGQLALYQKCGFRIERIDRDFFIKNYKEEIFENGIRCMDMVRLSQRL
ncbi:GNAT family N-acetyltransferase [Neobacillus piezotolerans]|uniref:GNAT family N-acetyltransferase n=1 Tax=Neobacillus piezotolerans TaxID=2259171 RepID=A0A3D8GMB5_9BACI|nr:GNAT family N-acetyltransferase [Neobacillus piezotolerans]RDU35610.1 GNAT family N-acetyltransferase [Neobacillus piezotolerans]